MPAGRPSEYTDEVAAIICRRLADGESLRQICRDKAMPDRETVRRWLTANSQFRVQYALARDWMVDALAERALEMAENATPENANARRVLVDAIKWYTGKVAPKKYGDRVNVEHSGKVTIGDAIEEGRRRVQALRDKSPGNG